MERVPPTTRMPLSIWLCSACSVCSIFSSSYSHPRSLSFCSETRCLCVHASATYDGPFEDHILRIRAYRHRFAFSYHEIIVITVGPKGALLSLRLMPVSMRQLHRRRLPTTACYASARVCWTCRSMLLDESFHARAEPTTW